jgi:ketosteroid isomerase-like protein
VKEVYRMTLAKFARGVFLLAIVAGFVSAPPALAQQKNKKYDDSASAVGLPVPPQPDAQKIDHDIGEMLGAFQVGNVDAMHKYYSDGATFVRGTFEPPLMGWANYVKVYQQQRAAFPGMQLIRRNTSIFVHQDVSWVSYQWEFESTFNGKPFTARGQTTLVLNKVGDNWLIVHNHTSEVSPDAAPAAAAQGTAGH